MTPATALVGHLDRSVVAGLLSGRLTPRDVRRLDPATIADPELRAVFVVVRELRAMAAEPTDARVLRACNAWVPVGPADDGTPWRAPSGWPMGVEVRAETLARLREEEASAYDVAAA